MIKPYMTIFSTYVEVILSNGVQIAPEKYFLHVCGGDPNERNYGKIKLEFSPRMWR